MSLKSGWEKFLEQTAWYFPSLRILSLHHILFDPAQFDVLISPNGWLPELSKKFNNSNFI